MKKLLWAGVFTLSIYAFSCKNNNKRFESLGSETGIDFTNTVENNDEMNIFNYRNFYNGAGVAIGDVNNDGLPDVYFVKNQGANKLYLNKGNWTFEDVTEKAGVAGSKAFSTGAVMADVNADGLLDIYVCNSGEPKNADRANELFINKGGLKFEEKAAEYGLNDNGYSTHAAFFDYDVDGDLDMFLLQNSSFPVNKLANKNIRDQRDSLGGQKLFRNDAGKFKDVSAQAGIYGSLIGFGLGITIGDFNEDHYPDIYISNDFYERDYLYINNKKGGFTEDLTSQMGHISLSSMGADVADINNDGHLDVFSTDMLPADDYRLKTTMLYEDINLYNIKLESDFHHQYSRNMLQLNHGNGTFSEVGTYAGVQATDWSWGALIFDMDLDGHKDLFVANGIYKNVTDQDFVQFLNDENTMAPYASGQKKFSYKDFMDKMAVTPIANYAFKQNAELSFENKAADWGLDTPSFSSGAAYADLDSDGDLDLIINNTNQPASILKNTTVETEKAGFLRVNLKGKNGNTKGIGAKVSLHTRKQTQTLEQMPNRGFESSVDYTLVFGLGTETIIDSISITWAGGLKETLIKPKINTTLLLDETKAFVINATEVSKNELFIDISKDLGLDYIHQENYFIDYDRDGLLKRMFSREGPALAVADLNTDGLEDVVLGAAAGFKPTMFLQNASGSFSKTELNVTLSADAVDALVFDADKDLDLDLLLVLGGNEFSLSGSEQKHVLLINDGKANFTNSADFNVAAQAGSSAVAFDYDTDGDLDLFIGARLLPYQYGIPPKHALLLNDGNGKFTDKSDMVNNLGLGMITDIALTQPSEPGKSDLIVSQDFGPLVLLKKTKSGLKAEPLANTSGWWNTLKAADIDADGDLDFIVGNTGLNTRLKPNGKIPSSLVVGDFDGNLRTDHIYECASEDGKIYPMVLKTDLQKQIPAIKKKYIYFKDFALKTTKEIFDKAYKNVTELSVTEARSGVLLNENGNFSYMPLPWQAQLSPVYGIETFDYNADKLPDLLLTGNFYDNQTELGRFDANFGQVLINTGKGNFKYVPQNESGLKLLGQVRKSAKIKLKGGLEAFILAKNNDKLIALKYSKKIIL